MQRSTVSCAFRTASPTESRGDVRGDTGIHSVNELEARFSRGGWQCPGSSAYAIRC